jgi:hypothetical protein
MVRGTPPPRLQTTPVPAQAMHLRSPRRLAPPALVDCSSFIIAAPIDGNAAETGGSAGLFAETKKISGANKVAAGTVSSAS